MGRPRAQETHELRSISFLVESKITTNQLSELDFPKAAIVGGVVRKGEGYIPDGTFQFRPKDRAVVLCRPDCIHQVEEYFK